jgi:hypothetical protein
VTACSVSCSACKRTWDHLCLDCAKEQMAGHTMTTGHKAELYIPSRVTLEQVREQMDKARHVARRFGW